jgi:hypothetical protein
LAALAPLLWIFEIAAGVVALRLSEEDDGRDGSNTGAGDAPL